MKQSMATHDVFSRIDGYERTSVINKSKARLESDIGEVTECSGIAVTGLFRRSATLPPFIESHSRVQSYPVWHLMSDYK